MRCFFTSWVKTASFQRQTAELVAQSQPHVSLVFFIKPTFIGYIEKKPWLVKANRVTFSWGNVSVFICIATVPGKYIHSPQASSHFGMLQPKSQIIQWSWEGLCLERFFFTVFAFWQTSILNEIMSVGTKWSFEMMTLCIKQKKKATLAIIVVWDEVNTQTSNLNYCHIHKINTKHLIILRSYHNAQQEREKCATRP